MSVSDMAVAWCLKVAEMTEKEVLNGGLITGTNIIA
jgi:hypothetical protein